MLKIIEEMLDDEQVEWKKLGDIADISKGKQYNKSDMTNLGPFPVINGGVMPSGYIELYNTVENTITVSQGGASAGFVNFIEKKFWLGAHAFSIIPKQEVLDLYSYEYDNFNRFLYHILKMKEIYLQSSQEGAGIPSISKEKLYSIDIPIVDDNVVKKIVEILDTFTNYVNELKAELKAREKQYTFYRDKLLSEEYLTMLTATLTNGGDNYITWKLLENVVKVKNGSDWKHLSEGSIPVYGSGGYMGVDVNKYVYDKPTVLIPRKGSIQNIFYLEKPFWNVDTIFYTIIDEEQLLPKYFYYFMSNYDLQSLSTSSTRPSLTQTIINKIKVPVPPLWVQEAIVKILDKFQEMVYDVSGLLPEEIEKRQKQYEYYREKLLTFHGVFDRTNERTIITSAFYVILKEAAELVGVKLPITLEYKLLGEIGSIVLGGTPRKDISEYWDGGTIPWANSGEVNKKTIYSTDNFITQKGYDNSNATLVPANSTIIALAGQGKTRGTVARIKISLSTNQSLATIIPKKELSNDFLYYYLQSQYAKLRGISSGEGTRGGLNKNMLINYRIPLPPKSVQEHVVSVLDKLDCMVNSITEGLPAEISMREKEYEYYREQLLTFPANFKA